MLTQMTLEFRNAILEERRLWAGTSNRAAGDKIATRRWVVERTFGWLMNYRRLCRNYECWTETSEVVVKMAMIHIMIRRLA